MIRNISLKGMTPSGNYMTESERIHIKKNNKIKKNNEKEVNIRKKKNEMIIYQKGYSRLLQSSSSVLHRSTETY